MLAIKRRGGTAIVQDPAEAPFPSMPESVIRYVEVDAVVSLSELPLLLLRLGREPVEEWKEAPMADKTDIEAGISEMDREALQRADTLGTPSVFSCPDCGGVLAEYYDGDLLRFRCQVGHAYSRDSLMACQAEMLDSQLWAAFRALDERSSLARRLAKDARRLNDQVGERRFTQLIELAEGRKAQIRQALLKEDEEQRAA
jgi:two-component system chemotaxis response regulator CheB